jgi:hypothetical protein
MRPAAHRGTDVTDGSVLALLWGKRVLVAIGICVVVSTAGCGGGESGAAPEPTQTAPVLLDIPEEDAPLEPGTYLVPKEGRGGADPLTWSIVDFTIEVPAGLVGNTRHSVGTPEDLEGSGFGLYPVLVDELYADPCEGERGKTVSVGPKPADLVKALLAQPGTMATTPATTTLGGLPATRIDLEVPKGADLSTCHLADFGPSGLQVWFAKRSQKYFVLSPGLHARVYVVDVDGRRQEFLAVHDLRAPAATLASLDAMIASIRIDR